jgi:hypothetical protein
MVGIDGERVTGISKSTLVVVSNAKGLSEVSCVIEGAFEAVAAPASKGSDRVVGAGEGTDPIVSVVMSAGEVAGEVAGRSTEVSTSEVACEVMSTGNVAGEGSGVCSGAGACKGVCEVARAD